VLGNADTALEPYVVAVAIETRTRGEMLTSKSHLLNTLGRDTQESFDIQLLGGSTMYYTLGHLDVISDSLDGRRRIHPYS
jgi:hypothetical protein